MVPACEHLSPCSWAHCPLLQFQRGGPVTPKKTLSQREKELQALLATTAGREELQEMALRYHTANGRLRPAKTSVITYILVHERMQGLVCD
jgi:hypothetical protein